MDFDSELKKVLKGGKVVIGEKRVKKGMLNGKIKMAILALNAPPDIRDEIKKYARLSNAKYYEYPESSKELGYKCGRPFPILVLGILDEGDSKILELGKNAS